MQDSVIKEIDIVIDEVAYEFRERANQKIKDGWEVIDHHICDNHGVMVYTVMLAKYKTKEVENEDQQ